MSTTWSEVISDAEIEAVTETLLWELNRAGDETPQIRQWMREAAIAAIRASRRAAATTPEGEKP